MDEFIICDICMEVYDGGLRLPRVFTCGHSFCSSCIHKLLTTSSFCPTCKVPVENESLETISINYILKQIVEKYAFTSSNEPSGRVVKEDTWCKTHHKGEPLSSRGYCKVHKVPKHFRCMTCNMWLCGDCAIISHKLCQTLLVKEAIEEMKKENNCKIRKHLEVISESSDDSLNLLGHYRIILGVKNKKLQCYQQKIIVLKKEISEVNQNIEKVSDLQTGLIFIKEKLEYQMKATNATSSACDLDKIEEKLTDHFNSLKDFTENLKFYKSSILQISENGNKDSFDNKEKLMASVTAGKRILITANEDSVTRYGKLVVKQGLFSIQSQYMHQIPDSSSSLSIALDNCLKIITGRKESPMKIFLQFSVDDVSLDDVIIRLQESSKEATKTVLRSCLFGEEGSSLKGVRLCGNFGGEFIYTGGWLPVSPDVDGKALLEETKKKKWNEGEMCLNVSHGNNGMEFYFGICVNGSNRQFEFIPTGQVEKGMEVIKNFFGRKEGKEEIKILNCGWVLN